MTPKQAKARRRRRSLPMPEVMGPSPQYLRAIRDRMLVYDDLEDELAELIGEYGWDRAMRASREYFGRWQEAKAALEAERLRNEEYRWRWGKGHLAE